MRPMSVPLLALAATLALLPGAGHAQSACVPAAPADGAVVTCSGAGTGIVDSGLDDAAITVTAGAEIVGADQGFAFDDDVTFVNAGAITGQGDHGVQGDNGVRITNSGTITGDADGVNIDNDGVLVNSGTIVGGDDGVQLEENAHVTNLEGGLIEGADEGVNINTDNAYLENHGTIRAGDDGVNAARHATIINTGTILSVGGAQDAIDLDSGTIVNSGTILAQGVEDGIDFDPTADASTITNSGLIEGAVAINTDVLDSGAQSIVNTGTLRGRSGVALNLGAGDDALTLGWGAWVDGLIDMGAGTDTVTVTAAQAATLRFAALPEVLDFAGPGVLDGTTLVLLDPVVLAAPERIAQDAVHGLVLGLRERPRGEGAWAMAFGAGGSVAGTGAMQGLSTRGAGLAVGQGLGPVSVFAALARGAARLDDGEHRMTQTATLVGVALHGEPGARTRISGQVVLGVTETDLRSPVHRSGDADIRGSLIGAGLGLRSMLGGTDSAPMLDLSLAGEVIHQRSGAYTLSGLGGGTVQARGATAWSLRAELGLPRAVAGGHLRPYLFGAVQGGAPDAISFGLPGGATTVFAPADLNGDTRYGVGLGWQAEAAGGRLSAGFEWATNADRAQALSAGLSLRFAF